MNDTGCFGCHEINGFDGPDKRHGPDLRLEPNYFAAAAQVKADPAFAKLTDEQRGWVEQLIQHPEETQVRHRLLALLEEDAAKVANESQEADAASILDPTSHKMVDVLADTETPGKMRKVGPALRYVKSKLNPAFMADWIWQPKHFRPETRMPQVFGLWDHLGPAEKEVGQELEPVELAGIVTYLRERSQPFDVEPLAEDIADTTAEEQVERGKLAFELRGCLLVTSTKISPMRKLRKGQTCRVSATSLPDRGRSAGLAEELVAISDQLSCPYVDAGCSTGARG